MSIEVEQPRLLPGVLVPDHSGPRRTTRDWLVDAACFVLAVAFGALAFSDAERSGAFALADALAGIPACLALWWRRRWPVPVALLEIALGSWSTAAGGASLIAILSLAVHRPFRVVVPVVVIGLLATPLYLATEPTPGPWLVEVLNMTVVVGATLVWGMFIRARRQLVLSLRDRAERAESEQRLRVEQARQHERTRIAREMHDVLAHRVSLLSLHAGALEFHPDAPPDQIARAAGVLRSTAHQALEDLRDVVGVLREGPDSDAPERPQPTLADLPDLIEESRQAGVRVTFDYSVPDLEPVPDAMGRNAYRIVQEGLTNARKHARGSTIDVTVAGAPGDGLTIELRNPLRVGSTAWQPIPGTGTGIIGLAERASLAGGRLEHGRTEDGHYRLSAWLPWPA
jgi:signal transduction histidine kinase